MHTTLEDQLIADIVRAKLIEQSQLDRLKASYTGIALLRQIGLLLFMSQKSSPPVKTLARVLRYNHYYSIAPGTVAWNQLFQQNDDSNSQD